VSPEWLKLVSESHQSSLFVLPEWLEAEEAHPILIGAFSYGQLAAGVVAYESAFGSDAPYQGLLLTAGATPRIVGNLIDWLEGVGGCVALWSAPSMLDVRPFTTRETPWKTHIRYTNMLMSPTPPSQHVALRLEDEHPEDVPSYYENIPQIRTYSLGEGRVTWGKDLQDRGYVLSYEGNFMPIVEELVTQVQSVDLCTCDGWTKKFHPKLRTLYGCIR
jgi:hypothetical protein